MKSWLEEMVSLYNNKHDNIGKSMCIGEIIYTQFAMPHIVHGKKYNDLETICALRILNKNNLDYKKEKDKFKDTLQGFAPAGLLQTRKADKVIEISRSGLVQLDFDRKGNLDRNMQKLKEDIFKLPFIAFCSLSCSGDGIYALAAIAEPEYLGQYFSQMEKVFKNHGIKVDTTKGKNVHDLRYVSY